MDGFQRHFDSQLLIYGKQTILNLVRTPILKLYMYMLFIFKQTVKRPGVFSMFKVNQKGSEKPLEQAFAKMVSGLNNDMLK